MTIDELPRYLESPGETSPTAIAERSAQERYLNDRVPPFWFEREIPDPSTWALRSDAGQAVPASGSTVSGHRGERRARHRDAPV